MHSDALRVTVGYRRRAGLPGQPHLLVRGRSLRATRRLRRRSVPLGRRGWEKTTPKPRWASLFECCPARFHKVFSLIAHRSTRTIYSGVMIILLLGLEVVLIAARQRI